MGVVSHAREPATQLDGGCKLAVTLEGSADGGGVSFGDHEHSYDVRLLCVAGKRRLVHGFAMIAHVLAWLKPALPMSRRDRARLAKLDSTRADIAAVADALRDLSIRLDARTHLIRKAARAAAGEAPDGSVPDPDRTVMTVLVGDAVANTAGLASALDQATEKLEQLAAALREE